MSNPGRHGRLVGFVAVSALALIPLATAGSAWADDDVSGDTGAAVNTPIGGGNVGGGADLGLPNPFPAWHPVNTNINGDAGVNTPIGQGDINTGSAADLGPGNGNVGGDLNSNTGAAVNTPIGGGNVGGGTNLHAGH